MNNDVWSVINTTSNVLSDADNVEKFNTSVQRSTTQERNLESSRIEKKVWKLSSLNSERSLDLAYKWTSRALSSARAQSSNASGTRPLRQRIYGTSITSALKNQRTVTGCGGSQTGMIGWGIRMILKLWTKRQLTVLILRLLNLKLENFLSGKLRALKIFNGHYQWILWLD